jgi:hypothetical protein
MEKEYKIKLSKAKPIDKSDLKKEIDGIIKEIYKNISKVIFVRKETGKIKNGMPLKEFVDKNAGLFTRDILTGFIKNGIIDKNSKIQLNDGRSFFSKKELVLDGEIKEAHVDRLKKERAGYILKQAGNLDSSTATKIFNDIMRK